MAPNGREARTRPPVNSDEYELRTVSSRYRLTLFATDFPGILFYRIFGWDGRVGLGRDGGGGVGEG